jgi:hypothetical protein
MSGIISSDIKWLEGERSLSFSVEGGTSRTGQSTILGYAPVANAFAGLNPNAEGKNWPIIFGTAAKVPAVRTEFIDDLTLSADIDYTNDSFDIINGSQLPQGSTLIRLIIGDIIFEGNMSGDTFTPTEKNLPKYHNQVFASRVSSDIDYNNPCVAWVPTGINLVGLYIYVESTLYGDFCNLCIGQENNKCTFAIPWWDEVLIDETWTLTDAAKYCRTDWTTSLTVYTDGDNLILTASKDMWIIRRGAPVIYDPGTDYADRYVANLYASTDVLAVWGKRRWNGKDIWAKIPSSYYHVHLNQALVTQPGSITRNITVIDFPKKLSDYVCENWENDIWITIESTLPATPREIIEWVVTNFTTFSWDNTSDDPPVTMNFAYFQTTDALEFIKGIAYQAASAIQINGTSIRLVFLAKEPDADSFGASHDFDDDLIIMKSIEMGFKPKEEINTIHRSTYVTDYSGEKTATKIYEINQNISTLGSQIKEDNMWALTCENPVKAITDFWGVKTGNSWKYIKMDCFLDLSDANVFDGAVFDIDPFVPTNAKGMIISVVHDSERPMVTITVELDIKAGTNTDDPNYWILGPATCLAPYDTEEDYIPPPDPICPVYTTTYQPYTAQPHWHIAIVDCPAKIFRDEEFQVTLEIHDKYHNLLDIHCFATARLYTTSPNDCFKLPNIEFTDGICVLTGLKISGSMIMSRIHLSTIPLDRRISGGDVLYERFVHINES